MFLFVSEDAKWGLENAVEYSCDGTFDTSTTIFAQIFVVIGELVYIYYICCLNPECCLIFGFFKHVLGASCFIIFFSQLSRNKFENICISLWEGSISI